MRSGEYRAGAGRFCVRLVHSSTLWVLVAYVGVAITIIGLFKIQRRENDDRLRATAANCMLIREVAAFAAAANADLASRLPVGTRLALYKLALISDVNCQKIAAGDPPVVPK